MGLRRFCYSRAMSVTVVRVALPVPLPRLFDYSVASGPVPAVGCRVRVPLARRQLVGVVLDSDVEPSCSPELLRPIVALLEAEPLLDGDSLDFLRWVSQYYHHPIGEVVFTALPARLRRSEPCLELTQAVWQLTESGAAALQHGDTARAPRQREMLAWLAQRPEQWAPQAQLRAQFPKTSAIVAVLRDKGWILAAQRAGDSTDNHVAEEAPELNEEQRMAVAELSRQLDEFSVGLLDGVTGSGKTEVYLQVAQRVIDSGRTVLVLVPEISLTPQLLRRFRARLGDRVEVIHSGLGESERERAWHRVRGGACPVLLGTRSAVFAPLPSLGLVIVDEEHDASFKQIEGLRYSARDLAIVRAKRASCPVILGSATPSLETLRQVDAGRYQVTRLDQRAGGAQAPRVDLLDLRDQPLRSGLSDVLLERVASTLKRGEQAMLFLNRRGYAPVLTCFSCGWVSSCLHCDAHQTWHRGGAKLVCHHCGAQRPVPRVCPDCGADNLHPLGHGTEQIEAFLAEQFPAVPLLRIDRDATARKGSLETLLGRLAEPGPALLVGTQMLAKGHDFPAVTLVGVVDADSGLFSADFRAPERLAQLLVQVSGRAGRGERPGQVLIQTRHPDHPLLQVLVRSGYREFAAAALQERAAAELPPFSYQALLRASAREMRVAQQFLRRAAGLVDAREVVVWGPVAAPMARRAGRERAQLLLQAQRREPLHRTLAALVVGLQDLPGDHQVRWSLDVDPIDLY
jgi:primosomal protein N' (replication factor Y)